MYRYNLTITFASTAQPCLIASPQPYLITSTQASPTGSLPCWT